MASKPGYRVKPNGPFDSMFPDARADSSGVRAREAALDFLLKEKRGASYNDSVERELLQVARVYWTGRMLDDAALRGSVNKQLKVLAKPAHQLTGLLQSLTREATYCLGIRLSIKTMGQQCSPDLDVLREELSRLTEACRKYTSVKHTRAGTGAKRVDRVCQQLWLLREYLTEKPFVKNFSYYAHKGPVQTRKIELSAPDARFVEAIVQAIDPEVESKTIRASLMVLSKTTSWKRSLGPGPGGR